MECSTLAHAAGLLSLVMAHGSSDGGSVGMGSKGGFEFLKDAVVTGVVLASVGVWRGGTALFGEVAG